MGSKERQADPAAAVAQAKENTARVLAEQAQYLRSEKSLLHDMEVDKYLHDCVSVYPETLNEEYVRVGADMAYWGHKYASARKAVLEARAALKKFTAKLYLDTRERLAKAGTKVTEALLDAEVESSQLLLDQRLRLAEAEYDCDRVEGVLDAIRGKKDMLVSLGATQRAEMDSDPITRSDRRERHAPRSGGHEAF